MMNLKSVVTGAVKCLFLVVITTQVLNAQVDTSTDSVFILYQPENNTVLEGGKKTYFKPELRYPIDLHRTYIIGQFDYCNSCDTPKWVKRDVFDFQFVYSPIESYRFRRGYDSLRYTDIGIEEFKDKAIFDQNWFNNTSYEKIDKRLIAAGANIFLVDPNYLYGGKYIMIRVHYLQYKSHY